MDDPENTLATAFQTIDGVQPRMQNLTNLVASLNPWERRHIRLQLGPRDGLASFEDLTVDLACLLARHLHLEDVLACAAVCSRSRATWTDPSAVAVITLHFFPAVRPPFTFAAFRAACRKYLRRRAGNFTARLDQPLPDVGSRTLEGEGDGRVVRRLDPGLHPDGSYPRGWDESLDSEPAGYGKGNIVWLAQPRFFVVDNLYTRERKVVGIPGTFRAHGDAAAGESLVVLFNQSKDKLLVYNLEKNTSSQFQSPSRVSSTALRGRRIFLGLDGPQVCVLDHDGARLLTTYHFNPGKGLEGEFPQFRLSPRAHVIYPHPHLQDRFFVVLFGWLDHGKPNKSPYPRESVNQYILAREYDGASPVATHEWQPPGEAAPRNPDVPKDLIPAGKVVALDDQGTYHAGSWTAYWGEVSADGLPQPPRGFFTYNFQASFNVMTKRFAVQRYLDPRGLGPKHLESPWHQQALVPWARRPGERRIRRYDADDADFTPSRVVGQGPAGARPDAQGWVVELEGLMEHTAQDCRVYHDGDFTVMLSEEIGRFYVWSFVEDEGKTATEGGQSRGEIIDRVGALNAGDILRTLAGRTFVR